MTSKYGDLQKLLEQTPESAYWIGFIMADGSFSKNRFRVTLSNKDYNHLVSMKNFLEISSPISTYTNSKIGTTASVALMDSKTVPKILEVFDIKEQKTYNPPSHLPFKDIELMKCFLVGFIDGDGYIRKQSGRLTSAISIVSHMSWLPFLSDMSNTIGWGKAGTRMGGVGSAKEYATLDCYVHSKNVELKIFASNYNLPVLDRKWERVDISVRADRYINSNKMRKMILDGKRGVEICQELGVSPSAVSNARARMNVDFRGDQR